MGYRDLLIELVTKDVKLKYRRSFLGYLWSILNPLMIMLVMVIVFSSIFRFDIDHYPVYLIIGQTIYNYVNNATVHAIYSVTDNGALLKKVYVPKYIFPLSKVTSDLVDFLFSLGAMVLVMLITGTQFSVYLILLPYVAIQIYVFSEWVCFWHRHPYFSGISAISTMYSLRHGCMQHQFSIQSRCCRTRSGGL